MLEAPYFAYACLLTCHLAGLQNLRTCFPTEQALERMLDATTPVSLQDPALAATADPSSAAATAVRPATVAESLSTSSAPKMLSQHQVRIKSALFPDAKLKQLGSKQSLTRLPLNKRRSSDLAASWMAARTVHGKA